MSESSPSANDIAAPPAADVHEMWLSYSTEERVQAFLRLSSADAEEVFLDLDVETQADLLIALAPDQQKPLVRLLAPDDAADLIQSLPEDKRDDLIALLNRLTRKEVAALLTYAEDEAGGLMSPRYARVRPEMTVYEAISYLRKQAKRQTETISYSYVLDADQHILGVVSLRELFTADNFQTVQEIMNRDVITVPETMNQGQVSRLLAQHNLVAIPVVDPENRIVGIVTVDDALEVLEEEVTEDMQKLGGMEAFDSPYLRTSLFEMIKKRAGWLAILFVGETLTASAMAFYESEIKKAVVLALFIPLIISSGGNAGSQASTLVIRAMALGELRTRFWAKVLVREIAAGFLLGTILGAIGFLRIMLWPTRQGTYGEHYMLIAATVFFSLMGVVMWGTISGSMLPLLLKRLGFDPASASAPFVATLVDVTGLVIYFSVASVLLGGLLL